MKNEYLNYFISLEKAKKMIIDEAIASLQHPSSKLWLDAGKNADLKIQNIITNWQKDPNNHNLAGYYSDTPEGPDQLGFNEWVESLSDVISNPLLSTPIGICIDGDWGIGKSFFIKMLFNNLSNDHFNSSGWMNIWIDSSLILSSKDTLNYISNTIYNNALSLSLKILGQDPNDQTASINWPGYLFSTKENEEPSDRIEKYLKNNVEKWSQDWQNKITNNFDWHILDLKKLIREIRYGILGVSGLSKIVIFIDDLDRCEEEVIWEIFSIHRSLLQEWGVIFIYAMDKRRVAEAIGNKLTYSRKLPNFSQYPLIDLAPIIKGELFLEKFFTHKIRPPQPSSKKLIKWFKSLIGNEFIPQNIGDGLEVGLSGNPRLIKQIANICGCIYNHLDSVDNSTISDSPWVRLISSINRNEIKQLICKTVVFAYGWPHIYEPIRMKPNRIKSVESCALTNSPISGYLQGKIISFPLDIGLQKLLIGNPKYPDKISHCYDIINIIDPYLTQAIHTERILQIIGYYDTKNVKTKTESSEIKHEIIASQQDINKTEEIISNWRENSDISLNILSILDYSLTINVADFFRNKNFNPIPEDLLNFAEKIHDSDLNSAKYLLIACLIHPLVNKELTLKCMETLAIIKENSLALEIFEYIQKKYLDDPKITPAYVGSLINMANSIDNLNDKKELINKAFILTYSYFNLNDNNIDKAVIDPTEEINQYWFSILFDVKTDNDEKKQNP